MMRLISAASSPYTQSPGTRPLYGMARSVTALRVLFACAVCCWVLGGQAAYGQNVQYSQGKADQSLRSDARVDPSSLGLSIKVPLGSYPGRGEVELPISLSYSSKLWRIQYQDVLSDGPGTAYTQTEAIYSENSASGWSTSLAPPRLEYVSDAQIFDSGGNPLCVDCDKNNPPPTHDRYYVERILVHMPGGSTHELRKDDTPRNGNNRNWVGTYYAVDSSKMVFNWSTKTLWLPDGSRYVFPNTVYGSQYIDRNGNILNFNLSTWQWTDTVGRVISLPPLDNQTPGTYVYTIPGVGTATVQYTFRWKRLADARTDPNQPLRHPGDRVNAYPNSQALSPSLFDSEWNVCVCDPSATAFNPVVLNEIELPDGSKYTFTYNVYGEIDKMTLPTGGYERYRHDLVPRLSSLSGTYLQGNRGVAERWVSFNGTVAEEQRWQYGAELIFGGNGALKVTTTAPDTSSTERFVYVSRTFTSYGFDDSLAGMAYEERTKKPGGQIMRRRLSKWEQSGAWPGGWSTATRNPRLTKEIDILLDVSGNALAATTTYQHDGDGNVISTNRHFYAVIDTFTAQNASVDSIPSGALATTSETTFLVNDPFIDLTTRNNYRGRNLVELASSSRLKNASGTIVAQSETRYDESNYLLLACSPTVGWADPLTGVRGNATTSRNWLDTTGGWIETHAQYDQCGNTRYTWDARGSQSQVEYSASYHHAYPTRTLSAVPDPSGAYGSTTSLEVNSTFDLPSGKVLTTTDANQQVTSYSYVNDVGTPDPFGRLRKVTRPTGAGWTKYNYGVSMNAGFNNQYVETITALDASRSTYSYQFFDGLGRPNRTFLYVEPGVYDTKDTKYDAEGHVWKVSNPYRTAGSGDLIPGSAQWTTTLYDTLGRVTSVTTPDNAVVTTSYDGNMTEVTDQELRRRRSYTDALGRLAVVVEDPYGAAYQTSYEYDAQDNLRHVTQDQQHRYFMYDSLGRLTRVKSPEMVVNGALAVYDPVTGNGQWSLGYAYDLNGNVQSRTDARGVTITYGYDNLNRNTTVDYGDSTPDVYRYYDSGANARGQLWRTARAGDYTDQLDRDAAGRPTRNRQWFYSGGVWRYFDTTYSYDLTGGVTGQIYPSGHTTTYQYDAAGRTSHFQGTLGDGVGRTYATGIQYDPAGRTQREQFGTATPTYDKRYYNNRGQLSEIRVATTANDTFWNRGAIINHYSNLSWAGSGTDNNGTLKKQDVYIPNDDAISGHSLTTFFYYYDSLNRLDWAREVRDGANSWVQDYDYDRYGNRTINAANTWGNGVNNKQFSLNNLTNQLGVPAGQSGSMVYDNAGNLTTDTYSGYGTRLYDAENLMTRETNGAGAVTALYSYDGDQRRVRRRAGGQEWWYVYGLGGELLAEYGADFPGIVQLEYGYRHGECLVTASNYGTQGLQADFYNSLDFTNPALTRTDTTVNFEWHSAAPGPGVGADNYTTRWTGYVTPRFSETYTFYVQADDGLRLWVNGQLLIDKWIDQGWTEWSGQITLQAGQRYSIKMEYYEHWGGAIAKLLWSSPSQAKEVIPASQLMPPQGGAAVRWLVKDQLGTPRMVLDQTGSLTAVSRHDYLPFGEEIGFGVGGRTVQQGYVYDGLRKQFAGNERDYETNLDFVQARYYSFTQGRFTSLDPLTFTQRRAIDPQQLNLYSYVRNDPLNFIDPDGKDLIGVFAQDATGELYEIPEDRRKTLQRELSRLAPGTKVDKQGRVHKPGFFRRLVNKATGHGQGTKLISRLVDSDKVTAIAVTNSKASGTLRGTSLGDQVKFNGIKPDALVFWGSKGGTPSPDRVPGAGGRVTDSSQIKDAPADPAVTLGHELIHADHIVNGTYNTDRVQHTFREGNTTYGEMEMFDEFRTVGFAGFNHRGDITENQLRKELGLRPRGAYSDRRKWTVKR